MPAPTKKKFETVDEYLETFPAEAQSIMKKLRLAIRKAVPGVEEAISYQIPTFKLNGVNLVHFAAYKSHIGFYPTPSGTTAFKKEIAPYEAAKATIRFPLDEPIPYELVKKIVLFRAKETKKKAK